MDQPANQAGPQVVQVDPVMDCSKARRIPINFCNLRHTNEEFVIYAGWHIDQHGQAEIDATLVMSPFTAKKLWHGLGAIISSWEQNFGLIETDAMSRVIPQEPAPMPQHIQVPPAGALELRQQQFAPPIDIGSSLDPPTVPAEPNNSPCLPGKFDQDP